LSNETGQSAEWVAVAVLGRVRGNRGEVTAIALSSRLERLESLRQVWLGGKPFEVESVWFHDGRPIFKFRGVDTISDAQLLVGAEVRIPLSDRVSPEAGEYFISDLVGCEVYERGTGKLLGCVSGFQECAGPGVLEVEPGNLLIPFARSICVEIEPAARRIVVELPEGLKDVNQP
jgi:16S rRNA processing protein RimM